MGQSMLARDLGNNFNITFAVLTQTIDYIKDGVTILVPAGTYFVIDIPYSIALFNEDHVDLSPDEYRLL